MSNEVSIPMRLAVIGSMQFAKDADAFKWAARLIGASYDEWGPSVVISGGADGIDSMAAAIARAEGIEVIEHLAKNRRWAPDGFQARNLLIAQDCTHLLCISHHASKTYGAGWTADRAEEMGKIVSRHMYRSSTTVRAWPEETP